jgi:hypothetical protein
MEERDVVNDTIDNPTGGSRSQANPPANRPSEERKALILQDFVALRDRTIDGAMHRYGGRMPIRPVAWSGSKSEDLLDGPMNYNVTDDARQLGHSFRSP